VLLHGHMAWNTKQDFGLKYTNADKPRNPKSRWFAVQPILSIRCAFMHIVSVHKQFPRHGDAAEHLPVCCLVYAEHLPVCCLLNNPCTEWMNLDPEQCLTVQHNIDVWRTCLRVTFSDHKIIVTVTVTV
jgi:hypothetical protein